MGIPALAAASLIAFSRVYLFVHYPTDILAGAFLGLLTGWFWVRALDWARPTKKAVQKREAGDERKE